MQDEKQARTKRYGGAHAEYRAQHSDTVHYPAPFGRLHSSLSRLRLSARMAQIARDLEGCRYRCRATEIFWAWKAIHERADHVVSSY